MREFLKPFVDLFTSLRLTVVLLVLGMILVFIATLDQVNLGVWAVQEKYFRSFIVLGRLPGADVLVPIFPGGYFIGGLLFINLISAHAYRFRFSWAKCGIWLTHIGLLLLLLGEFFTGLWQRESVMRFAEGETRSYSESQLVNELAVINTTDPQFDDVVAIPAARLEKSAPIQHPKLPFRIQPKVFYPNAALHMRSQAPNAPPSLADQGFGPQLVVQPLAITYKPDERNTPAAVLDLAGPDGPLGTWLVSTLLGEPQTFSHEGRTWLLVLRPKRYYKPFSLTLLKVTHDRYPGTEIPKNFSSRVRLRANDGGVDRETLIYMNNPLRHGGLTFYQYQMDDSSRTSALQVVRNPSRWLPYISCALMGFGLVIQFGIHLFGFIRKRRAAAAG